MMAANRMTKSEFVNAVAERSGLNKKQAATVLEAVSEIVTTQLKSSGEVTIPGLIRLSVSTKEATPSAKALIPSPRNRPSSRPSRPARWSRPAR
jgi:hypothetical protein